MLCVFIGFVVAQLVSHNLAERESSIFAVGFLVGGLFFAWILGAFDAEYGVAAASGYGFGLFGLGFFLLRGGKDTNNG